MQLIWQFISLLPTSFYGSLLAYPSPFHWHLRFIFPLSQYLLFNLHVFLHLPNIFLCIQQSCFGIFLYLVSLITDFAHGRLCTYQIWQFVFALWLHNRASASKIKEWLDKRQKFQTHRPDLFSGSCYETILLPLPFVVIIMHVEILTQMTHPPPRAMVATYLTVRGVATCLQLPLSQVFKNLAITNP